MECPTPPGIRLLPHPSSALVGGVYYFQRAIRAWNLGKNNLFSLFFPQSGGGEGIVITLIK